MSCPSLSPAPRISRATGLRAMCTHKQVPCLLLAAAVVPHGLSYRTTVKVEFVEIITVWTLIWAYFLIVFNCILLFTYVNWKSYFWGYHILLIFLLKHFSIRYSYIVLEITFLGFTCVYSVSFEEICLSNRPFGRTIVLHLHVGYKPFYPNAWLISPCPKFLKKGIL